jgi:hypothetical protein
LVHFVFLRLKVCFGNCVVKKTILVILNNYLFWVIDDHWWKFLIVTITEGRC